MYVVIFRATARQLDDEYFATAQTLRRIAIEEFGCLNFVSASENGQEIAVSYWRSLDDIARWKQHPVHQTAQQKEGERWYGDYHVEVVEIVRQYGFQAA